jgi:hypothetical protein
MCKTQHFPLYTFINLNYFVEKRGKFIDIFGYLILFMVPIIIDEKKIHNSNSSVITKIPKAFK